MFRRSSTRRATRPARRGASCGLASMSALPVQVVVDGGAVYADGARWWPVAALREVTIPWPAHAGYLGLHENAAAGLC